MAHEELIQSIVGKLVQDAYWANQAASQPVDRLEARSVQGSVDGSPVNVSRPAVVRQ